MLALALVVSTHPASQAAQTTASATTTQALLEAADGASGDNFGTTVALDGDLMAVGAPYADLGGVNATGTVYLYQGVAAAPSGWAQIKKFTPAGLPAGGLFGQSVTLQGDVLAVGAPREDGFGISDQGAVYIFERDQGGANAWGLAKKLSETVGAFGGFGNALALDDGLLLVGAKSAFSLKGAAYLFERTAGWGKIKQLLDPASLIGDYFGASVAISGDTVAVGEPMADVSGLNGNEGAAFVFERNQGGTNNWGQVTRLVADFPEPNSQFGDAVALDGDTIVVGAWNASSGGSTPIQSGAAFVYERAQGGPNAWGLVKRLTAQLAAASDYYGGAVAIAGDSIWVGAQYSDSGGFTNQGSVYRYGRDLGGAGTWGQAATLEADDGSVNDRFGGDGLDTSGATIAVSATGRSSDRGAVYTFGESETSASYAIYLPVAIEQYIPPNGILPDGGVFQEPEGAIVGAVEGTLAEPLPVLLVETTAPTQTLDVGTPTGAYYRLAAERVAVAPADKPFLLGLPVPTGVITGHLAVAVLSPPGSVLDAGENEPLWVASMGHYDAANNLFVVTLSALKPSGLTVVLVSNPIYEPIPTATAALALTAVLPKSFSVSCHDAFTYACTPANKDWVRDELERAYVDFVTTLGFMPPALNSHYGEFTGSLQQARLGIAEVYYNILIRDGPCRDNGGGEYDAGTEVLVICLKPNVAPGITETETVRHEFFHAIQYAYPNLALDWDAPNVDWLIEGTATAAERSSSPLKRRIAETRHPITVMLTDFENRYRAQDFWVYTFLTRRQSIAYLRPIFEAGGTPEKIYSALALGDAYWAWIKNQAFEKTERAIDYEEDGNDGFQYPTCVLEHSLVDPPLGMYYPTERQIKGRLTPLTSAVVAITFEQPAQGVSVWAQTKYMSSDLRYKVYDQEGQANCAGVRDGERTLFINTPAVRYVVVSNVSATDTLDFVVGVSGG
jgi:hypothetical protein